MRSLSYKRHSPTFRANAALHLMTMEPCGPWAAFEALTHVVRRDSLGGNAKLILSAHVLDGDLGGRSSAPSSADAAALAAASFSQSQSWDTVSIDSLAESASISCPL